MGWTPPHALIERVTSDLLVIAYERPSAKVPSEAAPAAKKDEAKRLAACVFSHTCLAIRVLS